MNPDQDHLLSKISDLSEDQKLDLFSVEELEYRLELTTATDVILPGDVGNGSCGFQWL